jgi:hypothetical protein
MEEFPHVIDRAYTHHQQQQITFSFYTDHGNYTGCRVQSLTEFLDALSTVPLSSLEFHLNGGDFTRWITDKGYTELAQQFTALRTEQLKGELLRETMSNIIQTYLTS